MEIIRPFENLPDLKREEYNTNYLPYVFIDKLFSKEEIDKIKSLWSEDDAIEGKVKKQGIPYINHNTRKSKIVYVEPEGSEWIYDRLAMKCIITNHTLYKFDILGFQSKLQIANYTNDDFFGWHLDIGSNKTSIRKISISVQLSSPEDYEGGELQFLGTTSFIDAPRALGSAIIFPSYIYHRVAPITSGSRKSLVGWIAGPPYK